MITTRFPLLDGGLAAQLPSADETIELMAAALLSRCAFDESSAIRTLSGRGFAAGAILTHVDAAIARAVELERGTAK
jgi:hypothetical protein